MARASTSTFLPLDRWAYVLGLEPRHFNQVKSIHSVTKRCHSVWFQYNWQASDKVSRQEVAQAIHQAEYDVTALLGYPPLPSWQGGEVVLTERPFDRTLFWDATLRNPRGLFQSVRTKYGHVVSGGVRATTLIGTASIAGATMTWVDPDGDGYFEYARLVLPTTVTDPDEVRVYFAGHGADDLWEVKPLAAVTIAGGTVTVDVDRHLLVRPALWEALQPGEIDGDVNGNFEVSAAVYRVYNDPSTQASLLWERVPGECGCGSATCPSCAWQTQAACLQVRDPLLGFVTYQPATWDVTTGTFVTAALGVPRAPERLALSYRAGNRWAATARPSAEMDPTLERIIATYAVTLLDRATCECDNVKTFVKRWMEDYRLRGEGEYHVTPLDLACPWGTREGAMWAWKAAQPWVTTL